MKPSLALVYGLVNVVLSVPGLYGYAAVIFSAATYRPLSALLARLVVLSSAVHMVCFGVWSTLPFAIGQVQDAGLIFLSHMATHVAHDVVDAGGSERDAASTTLFALGFATATLGCCLWAFGRARLTFFVSYLPMPVLGGYLAFIGLFCIEAGLGLCIGDVITGPAAWSRLWEPRWRLVLAAPGVLGGYALYLTSRNYASVDAALPLAMGVLAAAFYVVVALVPNYSFDQARADGWLGEPAEGAGLFSTLSLYTSGHVYLGAAARAVAGSWVAMVIVVAFSSCLDVAAIEVDLGRPLDMDAELATVGKSNLVAGLCGGFTGSYIFSQTIFTCRTGYHHKLVGWCVAVLEFTVVALPFDLTALLPRYFFAATLLFVGIDLVLEWLWEVRTKYASASEYAVSLVTFAAIQVLGLDTGLLVGLVAAGGLFLATAVSIRDDHQPLARVAPVSRSEIHNAAQARALERMKTQLVVLELRGLLWWGTAASMVARIKTALKLEADDRDDRAGRPLLLRNPSLLRHSADSESTSLLSQHRATASSLVKDRGGWHLILDLHRVDGLDASAVRSLFVPLMQLAQSGKFALALVALNPSQRRLLRCHGVAGTACVSLFDSVDDALDWATCRQLEAVGLASAPPPPPKVLTQKSSSSATKRESFSTARSSSVPESGYLSSLLSQGSSRIADWVDQDCISLAAARFLVRSVLKMDHQFEALAVSTLQTHCGRDLRVDANAQVFAAGDRATAFYCVITGAVGLTTTRYDLTTGRPSHHQSDDYDQVPETARPGAFFGFVDALADTSTHNRRTFDAFAKEPTTLAVFDVHALDAIFTHSAEVLVAIQRALLRQASRELLLTTA